ncbi:amidohydrolase, partial [bacterium]|nr:amidohydrolase [bacterium]
MREFIFCASDELQEKTNILSDHIWDAAETAFTEFKSAAYLKEYLASEGFTIASGVADIPTAFTATYGSGRPHIGLLAEYDALSGLSQEAGVAEQKPITNSGNGHGCGHNLLGAGCAHAGVLIKRYLAETGKSGTVTVFGCPAEEGGSGKTRMAGKGVFAGLDCALSWHPGEFSGVVPVSTMANIQVNYRFHGKASHAASSPYMGRSALDAVELMNVGSNYLREHIPPGCMLHYAILNTGGFSPNVVQAEAEST